MKTKLFFSIALVAMFFMQTNAQNVATPVNTSAADMETANSDYVTIESRVPYFVATDNTIQAMTTAGTMKQSIFKWVITDASDVNVPGFSVLNVTGTAASSYDKFRNALAGTGYFDNEMSILFSTSGSYSAGTHYKVKVAEKSVTLSTTIEGCEDVTPVEKDVYVLARPTVAFIGTEGGGCTVSPGSDYYVQLNLTGLGNWKVEWSLNYNGAGAVAQSDYDLTLAAPSVTDATVIAESTTSRTAAGTETATPGTTGLKVSLPAGQFGYYDVKITNISDRTSRKSLDALAASGAAGSFRIYVNPVPETNGIQHVKNL
jgi:hypothetical protein